MIPVIDNWVLIVDGCSYTVAQYCGTRTKKDGKEEKVLRNAKYYTSLLGAFRGLRGQLEREILSQGFPSLTEAIHRVIESNERLEDQFRRIADALGVAE